MVLVEDPTCTNSSCDGSLGRGALVLLLAGRFVGSMWSFVGPLSIVGGPFVANSEGGGVETALLHALAVSTLWWEPCWSEKQKSEVGINVA